MPKTRLPAPPKPPGHQPPRDPGFKPKYSGAIRRIGPVTPREPPANKPQRESGGPSLYRNK